MFFLLLYICAITINNNIEIIYDLAGARTYVYGSRLLTLCSMKDPLANKLAFITNSLIAFKFFWENAKNSDNKGSSMLIII